MKQTNRLYDVLLKSPETGRTYIDVFSARESLNHQDARQYVADNYDPLDVVLVRPSLVDVRLTPSFSINQDSAELLNLIFGEEARGGVNYLDDLRKWAGPDGAEYATLIYVARGRDLKVSIKLPEALAINWGTGERASYAVTAAVLKLIAPIMNEQINQF